MWDLAAALVLAAVALAARVAMRARVFQGGEVVPVEEDGFYHLRRIARTFADFPAVPTTDPLMGWPRGAPCPWPEGFDLLAAASARAVGCSSRGCAEVVAAWFPAALGVAVVVGAFALTARLLDGAPGARGGGFLAGLFVALAPQSVATSLVGRVDHHVAEQATALALLAWCAGRPRADAPAREAWRFEAFGAVALGLGVWCFSGSVLYAALAAAVLALRALTEELAGRRSLAGLGAASFLAAAAFTAWRVGPAVRSHGRALDYLFPSYLHPALLGVAGVAIGCAGLIARGVAARSGDAPWVRFARRVAPLVGLGAAALGIGVLLAPSAWAGVVAGLRRWLSHEDPWMDAIAESQPVFRGVPLRAGLRVVYTGFGAAGFAVPIAVAAASAHLWRVRRGAAAPLAVMSTGLIALFLTQMRFGRVLIPVAGVALGVTALALASRLRAFAPRAAPWAPWALAALMLVDPRARTWFRAHPAGVAEEVLAARFIRRASAPGDGVLTTWPDGHVVMQVAERPVIVCGFGSYVTPETFWAAERAWLRDEENLEAVLAPREVRWVMAGVEHFGGSVADPALPPALAQRRDGTRGFNQAFYRRLPMAALTTGGGGAPRLGTAHLRQLLPRFAVGVALTTRQSVVPALWVYERVRGATLRGRGPEGATVTLTYGFSVNGRETTWVAWGRVRDGAFALATPLPTRWRSEGLATPGPALLRVGDGPATAVEVSERAVRSGATLAVGE